MKKYIALFIFTWSVLIFLLEFVLGVEGHSIRDNYIYNSAQVTLGILAYGKIFFIFSPVIYVLISVYFTGANLILRKKSAIHLIISFTIVVSIYYYFSIWGYSSLLSIHMLLNLLFFLGIWFLTLKSKQQFMNVIVAVIYHMWLFTMAFPLKIYS